MGAGDEVQRIAEELLAAHEQAVEIPPISDRVEGFDLARAYEVSARIAQVRRAQGWTAVGRKIGFTNRTIWELYGVDGPMWAPIWDRTLIEATEGAASVSLAGFVQPRIEPEVVVKLAAPVPEGAGAEQVLERVEWVAAGFEVVQCHLQGWRFTLADATADFGLHGALVVGPPASLADQDRSQLAAALATFEASLSRDGEVVARGTGENVLGSPALAVAHLAATLRARPEQPPLAGGEVLTTGTLTDASPIAAGQTWSSDYGGLGLQGLTVTFT